MVKVMRMFKDLCLEDFLKLKYNIYSHDPEERKAEDIKDFKPISLVGSLYKRLRIKEYSLDILWFISIIFCTLSSFLLHFIGTLRCH